MEWTHQEYSGIDPSVWLAEAREFLVWAGRYPVAISSILCIALIVVSHSIGSRPVLRSPSAVESVERNGTRSPDFQNARAVRHMVSSRATTRSKGYAPVTP